MRLVSWLAVLLCACTASPGEVEEEMPKLVQPVRSAPAVRAKKNPLAWGRKLTLDPNAPLTSQSRVNWQQGVPLVILQNPDLRQGRIAPCVQNMVLQLTGFSDSFQDQVFRWLLDFGAGGARSLIKIDANGVQQVSMSAEMLTVSLISDGWGPSWSGPYNPPDKPVQASVFYADGNTATNPPTYTERFFIPVATPFATLQAPAGAVAWRIIGWQSAGHADSPFSTGVNYLVQPQSGGAPLDVWDGPDIEPIRNQVIPFPASAANILVSVAADTVGGIEWTIDL